MTPYEKAAWLSVILNKYTFYINQMANSWTSVSQLLETIDQRFLGIFNRKTNVILSEHLLIILSVIRRLICCA